MKNISNTFILSVILVVGFQQFAIANNDTPFYPVANIPAKLLENAHSVIRHQHTAVEIKSLDKMVIRYETVVTLLKSTSPFKDVVVPYDEGFDKLDLQEVSIYDKWGELVRKIKRKEWTDHSSNNGAGFDDGRFLYAEASNPNYPYTIAYEYEIQRSMTMFYPDWNIVRDYEISVEKSEFTIQLPYPQRLRYQLTYCRSKIRKLEKFYTDPQIRFLRT